MFADTAVHTSVFRDAIYAKTAKGRSEVTARGIGLKGRQRTVLIMLDGQRSCAALAAMMPEEEVADTVTVLLALDLIALRAGADAASERTPEAVVSAVASAAVPAGVPDAGASQADAGIAAIKAYMVQAAQTYLGLLAAEVVERIERAHDAAQLRGVVGHWHMALQASKHGRATAATHIEYVRTGLREAGIEA